MDDKSSIQAHVGYDHEDRSRKQFIKDVVTPQRIAKIKFGLMNPVDMRDYAQIPVINRGLYHLSEDKRSQRSPTPYGALDLRLGISSKTLVCETCGKRLEECSGHFGCIDLALPVFHVGYFKTIINILQVVCKDCSRIMLPEPERRLFLHRMRSSIDMLERKVNYKLVLSNAQKHAKSGRCPYCNAMNGGVKKTGVMKIVHNKFKVKKNAPQKKYFLEEFENATAANEKIKPHVGKALDNINPLRALTIFQRMIPEDIELLDMDSVDGRPENLILTTLLVPPVCIRPSIEMGASQGSNEDDLTILLGMIIGVNNGIAKSIEEGATMQQLMDQWDSLQIHIAMYMHSENRDVPKKLNTTKIRRGFVQRLKGKKGRFRGNLSGKRVDFSSRTVISPDPNLSIDQVGVPELVAKVLTYPERVTPHNIDRLRKLVENGPEVHPGARYLIKGKDGDKTDLRFGRARAVRSLRVGDIVERHLDDGDVVLFNRQPSLHRISIMAHRVKVFPWRTFRFNECVCTPYNADFDGDEMNLHVPQTEEARAEALELMGVVNNILTPRHGVPLVAATQDFITASYLITQKDNFFHRAEFARLAAYMSDATERVDIPPPAILKPIPLWTGKQLMSLLVRPTEDCPVRLTFEMKTRSYSGGTWYDRCPMDGWLVLHNSRIMCGVFDKASLGDGSKDNLFHLLLRDYGAPAAAGRMRRLAKLCARFLGDRGFSVGIQDVQPSPALFAQTQRVIQDGYDLCERLIGERSDGKLKPQPGCSVDETLEAKISSTLSNVRKQAGDTCVGALNRHNAPLIMTMCGSKGSRLNISQMVACVGQQIVNGSRIPNGFVQRTLPHFSANEMAPDAKGFVRNSFYSGLSPTEFFFHTMGGREGLVDTAVKTAETGYMQRRLIKVLEDLTVHYGGTSVRNSTGGVVQFEYGDDGLDPLGMEADERPVDLGRVLRQIQTNSLHREERALAPDQLVCAIEEQLGRDHLSEKETSHKFREEVRMFFYGQSEPPEPGHQVEGGIVGKLDAFLQATRVDMHHRQDGRSGGANGDDGSVTRRASKRRRKKPPSTTTTTTTSARTTRSSSRRAAAAANRLGDEEEEEENDGRGGGDDDDDDDDDRQDDDTQRAWSKLLDQTFHRITPSHLETFFRTIHSKYKRALIEPGTAVGAIAAQSIGEPGTQMTLKTFHFAGVASMNVTLGVPRIKEVINAAKKIATPIITAALENESDECAARMVKGRMEKTTLGQIAKSIREVYAPRGCYVAVRLDMEQVEKLYLGIDSSTVKTSILLADKKPKDMKITDKHVRVKGNNRLHIFPTREDNREHLFFDVQTLKSWLPNVIVKGIPSINRAVIGIREGTKRYQLLVEGYGLRAVMATPGVNGRQTTSNHVLEVAEHLGIEAARVTIMSQLQYVMGRYGLKIDTRHVQLLADCMTFKGEVLGINRFGIAKMKSSVLMLASFEQTADHLFDAAVHGREDDISGVSECIITGVPMSVGTGLLKLLMKPMAKPPSPTPLFLESPEFQLDVAQS